MCPRVTFACPHRNTRRPRARSSTAFALRRCANGFMAYGRRDTAVNPTAADRPNGRHPAPLVPREPVTPACRRRGNATAVVYYLY